MPSPSRALCLCALAAQFLAVSARGSSAYEEPPKPPSRVEREQRHSGYQSFAEMEARDTYPAPHANRDEPEDDEQDEQDYYYDDADGEDGKYEYEYEEEEQQKEETPRRRRRPGRVVQAGSQPRFMERSGHKNNAMAHAQLAIKEASTNEARIEDISRTLIASAMTGGVGQTADTEQKQMETALAEVKDQIVRDSQEINRENEWIKQVDELMKTYATKRGNVAKNVLTLRETVKELLKKKRQVQNLILQKELETKLSDANADMQTLETALAHVQDKESSFSKTRSSLQDTMDKLSSALGELKGAEAEQGGQQKEGENKEEQK